MIDIIFVFLFDGQPLEGDDHFVAFAGRGFRRRGQGFRRVQVARAALRVQLPFEIQQLAHEVEVGRDVGLLAAHKVVRVVQAHRHLVHQVGHRDCHRARDPCQTVH